MTLTAYVDHTLCVVVLKKNIWTCKQGQKCDFHWSLSKQQKQFVFRQILLKTDRKTHNAVTKLDRCVAELKIKAGLQRWEWSDP